MKKKHKLPEVYKGCPKNPDGLFDLICARNWFSGNLNANIPVEESRAAFEVLKEWIKSDPS